MRILHFISSLCVVFALPRYYRDAMPTPAPFLPQDAPDMPVINEALTIATMPDALSNLAQPAPLPIAPGVAMDRTQAEPLVTTPQTVGVTVATNSVRPLPEASIPPVDKTVDLDGDGELSLREVQYAAFVHHGLSASVVESMFRKVDADGSGALDSIEFNNIRPLVLEKAENAAMRYMQSVDLDHNKMLSLSEAQAYLLKEYGIGHRDVERIWLLVAPNTETELDAVQFSKLRRRIRGMTIRLARQMMKTADTNGDGHISVEEAKAVAFEQEGIGAGDVSQMVAAVDENLDGELNAPEFADFQRMVRARAVETSKKALKVVDADGSNTVTLDEAKRIAFEHYGFDENVLSPFFDQADENEDGQLDAVEFCGFRTVIRARAVKDALAIIRNFDLDGDGFISFDEAVEKTRNEDDMEPNETQTLFNIADQNKSGKLDKVEFADFIRLVRLSAIRFATEHFKEFDSNGDGAVSLDELAALIESKYGVPLKTTASFFRKVDVDQSGDLIPAEIVDFRHEIRKHVAAHSNSSQERLMEASGQVDEEELRTHVTVHRAPPRRPTYRTTVAPTTTTEATEPPAMDESLELELEPTTRRKVTYKKKSTTISTETSSTSTTTTTTEAPTTYDIRQTSTSLLQNAATKRQSIPWRNPNKVKLEVENLPDPKQFDRKRLIDKQKKELNIAEDTEVIYLDDDESSTYKPNSDDYEIVEYVVEVDSTDAST